jgi:hypothetical protein
MRKHYDFSKAKRGAVVAVPKGKSRITIRLDDAIIDWFKAQVEEAGGGNHQSLINAALCEHIGRLDGPLEKTLRAACFVKNCAKPAKRYGDSSLKNGLWKDRSAVTR